MINIYRVYLKTGGYLEIKAQSFKESFKKATKEHKKKKADIDYLKTGYHSIKKSCGY